MAEKIRTVRVEEFDDFMRFLERCYGHSKGFFQRAYPHLYHPDDPDICACCYVLERDGKIASNVGVYPINSVINGVSIPINGIGGVATLPKERGKGYMSRLMYHVIGIMRENGCLVSGLGGDRQRYNKFGWELAGLAYHLRFSPRSLDLAKVKPVSIKEQTPEEALQTIKRFQTHTSCYVNRPHPELQVRKQGLRVWVADDGYAIASGEARSHLSIMELVSDSGNEAGMIRAMLDRVFSSDASWKLSSCDQERLERLMPCVSSWSAGSDWMYRIISLAGLLTACKPILQKRASGLRDFDLGIGIREHDKVDTAFITVRNSTIEITPERTSHTYIEFDPVTAARLVFGGPPGTGCKEIPSCLMSLLPLPIHVPQLDHV